MPIDYPGGYLLRFDNIDVGRFRELIVAPRTGPPIQNLATLTSAGPGSLGLRQGSSVSPAGDTLLHRWQQSSVAGAAPGVVIVALSASGAPAVQWQVSKARPAKPLATTPGGAPTAGRPSGIESVEMVHEGIKRAF